MPKNIIRTFFAWLIHLLTASGAVIGLFAGYQIYLHQFLNAFWLMFLAIFIDAIDGYLARLTNVKKFAPRIDGALLDNIVDFFNYALIPAFLLLVIPRLLPTGWHVAATIMIILASCYQFTQTSAKTQDHFFKGFPSYWNIVVFYLFFWDMNVWVNIGVIIALVILSFVPIKYVYPSRLDHFAKQMWLRCTMFIATIIWGFATLCLLMDYPHMNLWFVLISMGYVVIYFLLSFYRTLKPLAP